MAMPNLFKWIGDLLNLKTTNKNSLVDAINEHDEKIKNYSKPATTETLGLIKVGNNLTITEDGRLDSSAEYQHPNDANTRHVSDTQIQSWTNASKPATTTTTGIVKIGDNVQVDGEGKISVVAPYNHPNDANTRHVSDTQINSWNNKSPVHDHPYILTSASCNKNWNWSGQNGQPTWLWGGNDATNMYLYNPSNFNVNHATNSDNSSKLGGLTLDQIKALIPNNNGSSFVKISIGSGDLTSDYENPSFRTCMGSALASYNGNIITLKEPGYYLITIDALNADNDFSVTFNGIGVSLFAKTYTQCSTEILSLDKTVNINRAASSGKTCHLSRTNINLVKLS